MSSDSPQTVLLVVLVSIAVIAKHLIGSCGIRKCDPMIYYGLYFAIGIQINFSTVLYNELLSTYFHIWIK